MSFTGNIIKFIMNFKKKGRWMLKFKLEIYVRKNGDQNIVNVGKNIVKGLDFDKNFIKTIDFN